jgi:hypothetical protein
MAFDQGRNMLWTWKSAWNKKHAQYLLRTKVVQLFNLIHVQQDAYPHRKY